MPWTRRSLLAAIASAAGWPWLAVRAGATSAALGPLTITSPDGQISATLSPCATPDRFLAWSATIDGRDLILPSELSLTLADGTTLGRGAVLDTVNHTAFTGRWRPPYGIARDYDESHSELRASFSQQVAGQGRLAFVVVIRAYDAGVAVRFAFSTDGPLVRIRGEDTHLRFPPGSTVYSSRDEGEYRLTPVGELAPVADPEPTPSTDVGALADTPLTVLLPDGVITSIAESDRRNYPRAMFASAGPDALVTRLMRFPGRATGYSGPGATTPQDVTVVTTPFETPWRVIAAARSATDLIERAGFLATLAERNRLPDTEWIRPGRAFRIRKPYTDANARDCIAFAAARKLNYVEFDAQWYGDGTDSSNATVPIAGLNVPALVAEARSVGIGVLLYVDRVPAERELREIVQTYRRWGVAGIKFGFIWEGRQRDVAFIERIVETCAEARLLVILHDDLRPAGLERTYPNYINLEGVRGNEHFPTARHNVTLPFTRNVAGPMDYTICNAHPRNQTTRAHQFAMSVIFYSPLTFLYWYDDPARYAGHDWRDLGFFDACPTTWDETRGLAGAIGEYVVVARRSGRQWFVGAMTNEVGRSLDLPLAFLGEGRWRGCIYRDGAASTRPNDTQVELATLEAGAREHLRIAMAPGGGQAIIFRPAAG